MNDLIQRLLLRGWQETEPRYDIEDRTVTYFFCKRGWVCEIVNRPFRVSFYKANALAGAQPAERG
jgi:hypothetical protein